MAAKSRGSEIRGTYAASLRASEEASLVQSLAAIAEPEGSAGHESGEAKALNDECETQLKILEGHVVHFCGSIQPELKNGSFTWLTYITDVDSADMASRIMHAFHWGKRDASHGLLFTKQSFHDKNSTLLLWSGVSSESREKWCKALNTYMLHAGSNDDLQTPFGRLIEKTKDQHGKLLGGCEWPQQEPIWQTASDAVVWRNGDTLVRFLVNKTLVKENWTLRETIFYRAELPTLARYPPDQGCKVFNLHPHVRCIHLMPIIRHKIEQNGLLDAWRKVKTFSCVDAVGEQTQENPKALDSKASEFLKPGEQMKPECAIRSLTEQVYKQCCRRGHVDYEFFQTIASQFPMDYRPNITSLRLPDLVRERPQLLFILPDIMEMFDTTIFSELCLTQFVEPERFASLDASLLRQACREAHAALPKLTESALTDSNPAVRRAAAKALTTMGKESAAAVPVLRKYTDVCAAAANTLRKALADSDPDVREAAAQDVGAMGKEAVAAVPELRKALFDWHSGVRAAAAQALGAMGKEAAEAVPELRTALADSHPDVRAAGAQALAVIGKEAPGAVLPELRKARLQAPHASGRVAAAQAQAALPELRKALKDSVMAVRIAAIEALAGMGAEAAEAVPELRQALEDSQDLVREAAAEALKQVVQ